MQPEFFLLLTVWNNGDPSLLFKYYKWEDLGTKLDVGECYVRVLGEGTLKLSGSFCAIFPAAFGQT